MSKESLAEKIELQSLKKENSSLKNKLYNEKEEKLSLKEKIRDLEENFQRSGPSGNVTEKLKLTEIKLTSNIRDDYEQIEQLAIDILTYGQLQPVLLTKDNFLLAGYRRYNAVLLLNNDFDSLIIDPDIKVKVPDYLISYRLEMDLNELSPEQIDEMQFSENEQRRSLDNFQISKLFNKYLDKGFAQKYICEKFKKNTAFVSAIVRLRYIDEKLVKWLKEFQIYAWSKDHFTAVNSKGMMGQDAEFYEKGRGLIGWKTLYEIAKQPDLKSQKKAFLKLFQHRLSTRELTSDFFKEVNKSDKKIDKKEVVIALKQTKSLSKRIKNLYSESSEDSKRLIDKINNSLSQIEGWLEKINLGK
jgi:ParB-like chromosome segregation protein Spo0J